MDDMESAHLAQGMTSHLFSWKCQTLWHEIGTYNPWGPTLKLKVSIQYKGSILCLNLSSGGLRFGSSWKPVMFEINGIQIKMAYYHSFLVIWSDDYGLYLFEDFCASVWRKGINATGLVASYYINGISQDCSISIFSALEILQSCTKSLVITFSVSIEPLCRNCNAWQNNNFNILNQESLFLKLQLQKLWWFNSGDESYVFNDYLLFAN